jgi:hypothetical protein
LAPLEQSIAFLYAEYTQKGIFLSRNISGKEYMVQIKILQERDVCETP